MDTAIEAEAIALRQGLERDYAAHRELVRNLCEIKICRSIGLQCLGRICISTT